jgi:two-component system, LytTR family, sensor histidine kinase AlgZ
VSEAGALFRDTLRALITPRRAIPVLIMAVPLLLAQHEFSEEPRALPLAVLMIVLFVVVAPFSFRLLFPLDVRGRFWARLLAYGALAILVPLVAWGLPPLIGLERSFLSSRANVWVAIGLFWVGGFGLGRDIELEAHWRREKERAEKLAAEAERAQLLALRANLDPHFLFNTLNAIAEWCREDAEIAEKAILSLASMLREILSGVQAPTWPLERELALVESLFELHKMRDPDRFTVKISTSAELGKYEIPALILLPLAENAMKHGPAKGNHGEVLLEVVRRAEEIHIAIENPGEFSGRREGGQGIVAVEKRARLAFGGRATFSIHGRGGRTRAELSFPAGSVA